MTKDEIQQMYDAAKDAYLKGQGADSSGSVGDRSVTKRDLEELRQNFEYWSRQLQRANGQSRERVAVWTK